MSSKYSTIQQHEPLRAPSSWGAQEKKFIAQLEEILDDIFRRFGRLKLTDLGDALRQKITDMDGNVNTLTQKATETESKIQTIDGSVNTLTQKATETESKIQAIDGNISTLTQNDESFAAAFSSIGTMGTQTGVTKVTEDGIEVKHTSINTTTKMNAGGFKIYDASGKEIGGLVVIDGKVYLASQALMNPSTPAFRIGVAQKDFEGEQMGLHWIFGGTEMGSISAHSGGMRQDVNGSLSLYPTGAFQVSCDSGFYIATDNGAGLYVDADGYTELRFQRYDRSGNPYIDRVSLNYIVDTVDSLNSD